MMYSNINTQPQIISHTINMGPPPQPVYTNNPQVMVSTYRPINVVAPMMPMNNTVISSPVCSTYPTARGNQSLMCPNCRCVTISNVQFIPGGGAWIACLILFIFVGFFGLIAFCVDECKDVHHYCSVCGIHLGEVRFMMD